MSTINIQVINRVQEARQGTPGGIVDANGISLKSAAIIRILIKTLPLNP